MGCHHRTASAGTPCVDRRQRTFHGIAPPSVPRPQSSSKGQRDCIRRSATFQAYRHGLGVVLKCALEIDARNRHLRVISKSQIHGNTKMSRPPSHRVRPNLANKCEGQCGQAFEVTETLWMSSTRRTNGRACQIGLAPAVMESQWQHYLCRLLPHREALLVPVLVEDTARCRQHCSRGDGRGRKRMPPDMRQDHAKSCRHITFTPLVIELLTRLSFRSIFVTAHHQTRILTVKRPL